MALALALGAVVLVAQAADAHHAPGHPPCERVDETTVPCNDTVYGPFFHDTLCYMSVAAPQPPPGHVAWGGHYPTPAVYWARCTPGGPFIGELYQDGWPGFVPVGAGPLVGALWFGDSGPTPQELADQAIADLEAQIVAPVLDTAPPAGALGLVGVPMWLWVANPAPTTWGPITATASGGGITVTATATVEDATWQMGDGSSKTCTVPGTPYPVGVESPSPDCGHLYTRTSAEQPGLAYPITATTHWVIEWSGGGESGSATTERSATTSARVGEVQVIIEH